MDGDSIRYRMSGGSRDASTPHHLPDDFRQPRRFRHHHPAAAVLRGDLRRVAPRRRPAVRGVFALPARGGAGAGRALRSLGPPADPDLQPRRHRRQLRDAGAGAQPDDAVPRAHRRRAVGRQHLDRARLRRRRHRAEGSRARLRTDRRGLRPGIHLRPGAERRARAYQLHGADLGGRGDHARRDADGVALAARDGASHARRARATRCATCRRSCAGRG